MIPHLLQNQKQKVLSNIHPGTPCNFATITYIHNYIPIQHIIFSANDDIKQFENDNDNDNDAQNMTNKQPQQYDKDGNKQYVSGDEHNKLITTVMGVNSGIDAGGSGSIKDRMNLWNKRADDDKKSTKPPPKRKAPPSATSYAKQNQDAEDRAKAQREADRLKKEKEQREKARREAEAKEKAEKARLEAIAKRDREKREKEERKDGEIGG